MFFQGFWSWFGRMMSGFCAVFLITPLFIDSSSASFETAVIGLLFAVLVSAVYGASEGDVSARNSRTDETNAQAETLEFRVAHRRVA